MIDSERILAAVEETMFGNTADLGFCVKCGEEHMGIEPDACNYECDYCGAHAVYGAEELLLMGFVE